MSLPDDGPAPDEFDDRTLSEIKAEGRENLARLRDTPGLILGTWAVRVAIVAAVIWLVNWLLGPFARIWWLLPMNPFVVVADAAPGRTEPGPIAYSGVQPMRSLRRAVNIADSRWKSSVCGSTP